RARAHCVPLAVHVAARAENPRHRRAAARAGGLRLDAGSRRALVLRLRRILFAARANAVTPATDEQATGAHGRRAPPDRHGQHRLPVTFASGHDLAGETLDRAHRRTLHWVTVLMSNDAAATTSTTSPIVKRLCAALPAEAVLWEAEDL